MLGLGAIIGTLGNYILIYRPLFIFYHLLLPKVTYQETVVSSRFVCWQVLYLEDLSLLIIIHILLSLFLMLRI